MVTCMPARRRPALPSAPPIHPTLRALNLPDTSLLPGAGLRVTVQPRRGAPQAAPAVQLWPSRAAQPQRDGAQHLGAAHLHGGWTALPCRPRLAAVPTAPPRRPRPAAVPTVPVPTPRARRSDPSCTLLLPADSPRAQQRRPRLRVCHAGRGGQRGPGRCSRPGRRRCPGPPGVAPAAARHGQPEPPGQQPHRCRARGGCTLPAQRAEVASDSPSSQP